MKLNNTTHYLYLSIISLFCFVLFECSENQESTDEGIDLCKGFTILESGIVELASPISTPFNNVNLEEWYNIQGSQSHLQADIYSHDLNERCGGDCDEGKEVFSVFGGKVIFSGFNNSGYGNQILIQSICNENFVIRYAHLEEITEGLEVGDIVNIYDKIGTIGKSGNQLYAHLHLTLYNGVIDNGIENILSSGNRPNDEQIATKFIFTGHRLTKAPEVFLPISNSTLPSPESIEFQWENLARNEYEYKYNIQISKKIEGWSSETGFLEDLDLVVNRRNCLEGNSCNTGLDVINDCFRNSYTWFEGSCGSIDEPENNMTYYWSVRTLSSGVSSEFSEPFQFKIEEQVHDGDLTLETQQEINILDSYVKINGNLTIGSNSGSNIINLDKLSFLREVTGSVIIYNNSLINLEGLNNLTKVLKDLLIRNNDHLENLDGLNNLYSIGEALIIDNNSSLENLNGLSNLISIGHQFRVDSNSSLINMNSLSKLESIGENLAIVLNNKLETLDGLENLTFVGGHLDIDTNPLLCNICGIANLILSSNFNNYLVQNNCVNPTQQNFVNECN